jgi:hypothetical protein
MDGSVHLRGVLIYQQMSPHYRSDILFPFLISGPLQL